MVEAEPTPIRGIDPAKAALGIGEAVGGADGEDEDEEDDGEEGDGEDEGDDDVEGE